MNLLINQKCPDCGTTLLSTTREEVEHYCWQTRKTYIATQGGIKEKEDVSTTKGGNAGA